ncbi:MAG TPA: MarR family EPS-associated transcriptional regulator [Caldimonas sp.]
MNERPPVDLVSRPAHSAPDLELLRLLERHPEYSQRQMSDALGVSLGKAHYLLKALLAKGWVKAQNFTRSDHKARYLYVLTPTGVRQRAQLTRAFLARKEREYDMLHAQIAALREELSGGHATLDADMSDGSPLETKAADASTAAARSTNRT